jgi:cytochrome c oxidase subunit 3
VTETEVPSPTHIPFQYVSVVQRRRTDRLGMLVALVSELLLFGGLFTGFIAYRIIYPAAFVSAAGHLDLVLGGAATFVILISSETMALGVRASRIGDIGAQTRLLVITILLGLLFLGLKFAEYAEHFRAGLVPGPGFVWSGPDVAPAELFFTFYYILTGLHAIHMFVGVVVAAGVAVFARTRANPADAVVPADLVGLYWHFVDLIWAFIFPLLYLISRR